MWKILYIGILIFSSFSCENSRASKADSKPIGVEQEFAFDESKWKIKEGRDYPYRNKMLDDFVYNDTVRSLSESEILELLGKPDRQTEGYFYYTVDQRRIGSWVLHQKSLVIKFTDESSVEWIKIHQ